MNTNEKKIYQSIGIMFILSSLPIVILSFYNVPSADDYTFGRLMKSWVTEHGYGIWGVLKCAVQNSVNYYFSWQGRYSESFFASFMPEIFGCYWLWAIFLYVFFFGSVAFFFRTLTGRISGKEHMGAGLGLALVTGTAIMQNVPFPVEALYWFDGSMAYMFHHVLYIWMCGLLIEYFFETDQKRSLRYLILVSLLTVLAAGGNNVTAFISILTYCIFLGIMVLIRRKWGVIVPFLLSVAGFTVSYLSPGTTIRGGDSSQYTPILLTIRKCFVWTIKQYFFKWTTAALLVMLVFLTPVLLQMIKSMIQRYHFRFPFPALVLLGDACFLSAMSCPSFYVLGEPGPGRLRNVIYVNFIFLVVLTYGYLLGWWMVKYQRKEIIEKISGIYQKLPGAVNGCIVLAVFGILCVGSSGQRGMSAEAVYELTTGQASQYHGEAMIRKEQYLDPVMREVEVAPYSVKPRLLFFDDITDDPSNWKNVGVKDFYGKEKVCLDRYDPDVEYD